ncbi:hypothetical protein [Chryseobacterium viscerum]|uniref:Uncharacterized protein n=1 Tax=Chryseobacterium viscerum TaxID=1037377 RepID=A0A316WS17_9FLAO|nr:hypothetical protein [Chryseobacterium viscerum]PWN64202.1 hypothetical protein C1634_006295 [Chryseobacterium viscerum]
MKNNMEVLEKIQESLPADSIDLTYIDGVLNKIIIKFIEDKKNTVLIFYNILEYNQKAFESKDNLNTLYIVKSDVWLNKYKENFNKEKSEKKDIWEEAEIVIEDFSVFNHYILNIEGYEFNILAEGYSIKESNFERYRDQKIIKKLVS